MDSGRSWDQWFNRSAEEGSERRLPRESWSHRLPEKPEWTDGQDGRDRRRPTSPPYGRRSRSPPSRRGTNQQPPEPHSPPPPAPAGLRDPREPSDTYRPAGGARVERRRRFDSPEPGQITPRGRLARSSSPEHTVRAAGRAQRRSPLRRGSAYTSSSSPPPPRRVMTATRALEAFTLAMRSALASSTLHENASQHLARLVSFPQATEDSDPVINAKKRVSEAEKTLHSRMVDVQQAFSELLKKSLAQPGVADGDVANLDLEWVKDRLARLEDVGLQIAPAPTAPPAAVEQPPAPSAPAAANEPGHHKAQPPEVNPDQDVNMEEVAPETEEDVRQGKRRRARELLESVAERLSLVEMRTEDIYSQLYAFEGNQRDPGIVSWEELYERRDPELRAQREAERTPSPERTNHVPKAEEGNPETENTATAGEEQTKASSPAAHGDVVERLRARVRVLEAEVATIKVEQGARHEAAMEEVKESMKEAMATYRTELEANVFSTVRQEIERITANFRAQQRAAKQGQPNGSPSLPSPAGPSPQLQNTHPAGAAPLSSPSIAHNVVVASPTSRAQTVPLSTPTMANASVDVNGARAASIAAPEQAQIARPQHAVADPRGLVHIDQQSNEPMVMVAGRQVPLKVAQQWAAHWRANGTVPEASMSYALPPQSLPPGTMPQQGTFPYNLPQPPAVSPGQVFQQPPQQQLMSMPPQQQATHLQPQQPQQNGPPY